MFCRGLLRAGHRDIIASHSAPAQAYTDLNVEGHPLYLQWNLALEDDTVLGVVPHSHARLNTPAENAQLRAGGLRSPLPGTVQTELRAGDAVVYMMPILHWADNYTPLRRRTIHGGFSEFTYLANLESYIGVLSEGAQSAFRRWEANSQQKQRLTAEALRAAAGGVAGQSYREAVDALHGNACGPVRYACPRLMCCKGVLTCRPPCAQALRAFTSACLSKVARRLYSVHSGRWGLSWGRLGYEADARRERGWPPTDAEIAAEQREAVSMHPSTFQWGAECAFAERFSANEAAEIYAAFEPLDRELGRTFCLTAREFAEGAYEKRDPETRCTSRPPPSTLRHTACPTNTATPASQFLPRVDHHAGWSGRRAAAVGRAADNTGGPSAVRLRSAMGIAAVQRPGNIWPPCRHQIARGLPDCLSVSALYARWHRCIIYKSN